MRPDILLCRPFPSPSRTCPRKRRRLILSSHDSGAVNAELCAIEHHNIKARRMHTRLRRGYPPFCPPKSHLSASVLLVSATQADQSRSRVLVRQATEMQSQAHYTSALPTEYCFGTILLSHDRGFSEVIFTHLVRSMSMDSSPNRRQIPDSL
ncbi:hypothetical protein DAEQUDRAFT_515184 [Daedalea quercina L-15889]|uniref:Uncharacterized protein n=1 Tax=Daedalea quercina L-15889 TaxID=1314783 RepID=A0A165MIJ3_9APHY|nr:hypothetical protein DAEQUDRAFT_515184 [Daedalea quercina L-15889]